MTPVIAIFPDTDVTSMGSRAMQSKIRISNTIKGIKAPTLEKPPVPMRSIISFPIEIIIEKIDAIKSG
tara:strand:+ start:7941 stop:8144 length:204 start_codon:yes stop_codon:yes gene_type:complete